MKTLAFLVLILAFASVTTSQADHHQTNQQATYCVLGLGSTATYGFEGWYYAECTANSGVNSKKSPLGKISKDYYSARFFAWGASEKKKEQKYNEVVSVLKNQQLQFVANVGREEIYSNDSGLTEASSVCILRGHKNVYLNCSEGTKLRHEFDPSKAENKNNKDLLIENGFVKVKSKASQHRAAIYVKY